MLSGLRRVDFDEKPGEEQKIFYDKSNLVPGNFETFVALKRIDFNKVVI